jgi:hexokinase
MKNKALNLRISERRLNKLRLYSVQNDTTMTHVIENFIDSLKLESGDSSSTPLPLKPTV